MGFLDIFRKTKNQEVLTYSGLLEQSLRFCDISVEQAMQLPAVASSVEKISSIVASVPFRLYRDEYDKAGIKRTVEVTNDDRSYLLNGDTGDLLDGYAFKKAIVHDYLVFGGGYAYINRKLNTVKSLNYVKFGEISTQRLVGQTVDGKTVGPIFKDGNFIVNGTMYPEMMFFRFLRESRDGLSGVGIVSEINNALATLMATNQYFAKIAKTGGIKKGFLESDVTLKDEELKALRRSWNQLYEENKENVVILNRGIKYHETSQTAAEAQMAALKLQIEKAVKDVFGIYDDHEKFLKETIAPILSGFETALNKYLLLEREKPDYHFTADTKELLKPTLKERADAYTVLKKAGVMSTNDIRYQLDLPKTKGGDVLSGSLGDVTINPATGEAIVFNTGAKFNLETFEVLEMPNAEGGNNAGQS